MSLRVNFREVYLDQEQTGTCLKSQITKPAICAEQRCERHHVSWASDSLLLPLEFEEGS